MVSINTKSDRRWSALALIVTAQFMVILDVAIVNVALPSIKSDLSFSETNLQWVVSAYAILFGGALLLGGRLADLLGRLRTLSRQIEDEFLAPLTQAERTQLHGLLFKLAETHDPRCAFAQPAVEKP